MNHSKLKVFILLVIILAVVGLGVHYYIKNKPNLIQTSNSDYKNTTYSIDRNSITLINGKAETEIAPGSASKQITQYFGNEVVGDFNGDGSNDVGFLLTVQNGGSGTFYYVVAALKTVSGYNGTNAILLGDRIAPQTTEFRDGEIIVNYADRNPTDAMTVSPSVGVSRYFKVSGNMLIEVPAPNTGDPKTHQNIIRLDTPPTGATITTPLTVTGQARGNWYFEASFPVQLLDESGNVIASAPAQAQGNWMTTEFVPFKVTLSFTMPTTTLGKLILKKDNPSGLPEKEDFISIPVKFNQ